MVGGELFIKSSSDTGTELLAEITLPTRKSAAAHA